MLNKTNGFTLIELLVVVLIIGILAAVAVPQYKKAVEKSRAAEALIIVKSIAEANKVYYMANGAYALHMEDLDIHIPGTPVTFGTLTRVHTNWFEYGTQGSGNPATIAVGHRLPDLPYFFNYFHADDAICCYGSTKEGLAVCKSLSNGITDDNHLQDSRSCWLVS
jgi:prepilin-type N-terminal cleavage/methylation domain-containing protein